MSTIAAARPRRKLRQSLVWMTRIAFVLYLAVILAPHFYLEPRLIFVPPTNYARTTPADLILPFEDLHIAVDGSTQIHAWWIAAEKPSARAILYFHGNGEVLESEVMKATREAPLLHQTGANLLLADYRGYGSSSPVQATGPRTEEDARAAMRYLVGKRNTRWLYSRFCFGKF